MFFIIIIISIWIFIKTVSYGVYELKGKNKYGGITVIVVATIALILPNVMVYIRGV